MALLDLSIVTDTLIKVLTHRVNLGWAQLRDPNPPPVAYSRLPGDAISGEQTIGLYLYHVMEDAHLKNQAAVSSDTPPVRYNPMGLQLYYQLTAHANAVDEPAMVRTQQLFGLAIKAFHDYPRLAKDTQFEDQTFVFDENLKATDSIFRITLLPITPVQAEQFWSSSTKPVRLAAYYQVSAVLLEPEVPTQFVGRVLRYGIETFFQGGPRLVASHNTVTYRLPDEATDRVVEARPAEAAINEQISFDGTDLSGDSIVLMINKTGWSAPQEASLWETTYRADGVITKVASTLAIANTIEILPGFYTASVKVTRHRVLPNDTNLPYTQSSNEVPFTVVPSVTNTVFEAGEFTITGGPFKDGEGNALDVQVIVGSELLPIPSDTLIPSVGPVEIVDAGELRFPAPGLSVGNTYPLRIIVNGAECAPRWIRVPS